MGTILAFLEPPPVEFTIKARPMRLIYQYRVRADPEASSGGRPDWP
ncbi:MAG: hypothetical protein IIC91_02735 [Chloroflexi bacterium]|nr:hypothetical protein [Chloroflexota bacterium]